MVGLNSAVLKAEVQLVLVKSWGESTPIAECSLVLRSTFSTGEQPQWGLSSVWREPRASGREVPSLCTTKARGPAAQAQRHSKCWWLCWKASDSLGAQTVRAKAREIFWRPPARVVVTLLCRDYILVRMQTPGTLLREAQGWGGKESLSGCVRVGCAGSPWAPRSSGPEGPVPAPALRGPSPLGAGCVTLLEWLLDGWTGKLP